MTPIAVPTKKYDGGSKFTSKRIRASERRVDPFLFYSSQENVAMIGRVHKDNRRTGFSSNPEDKAEVNTSGSIPKKMKVERKTRISFEADPITIMLREMLDEDEDDSTM